MKKVLFAVALAATTGSMSYAENAMYALKEFADPILAAEENAFPAPAAPASAQDNTDPFTTVSMEEPESSAMMGIIGRVNYMGKEEPGDCYSYEAVIESRSLGFNPAKWSIIFVNSAGNFTRGKQAVPLTGTEIPAMIAMFNRLHVAATRLNSASLVSGVTIIGRSCHTLPLVWTVAYKKNPKFD